MLFELATWLAGVAGFFFDGLSFITCCLSNPRSFYKFLIILKSRRFQPAQFVEAGTYRGVTSLRCSYFFESVFSVELSSMLFQKAKKNLARKKNITLVNGDALVEIPKIFENGKFTEAVVFLDGHFSGGVTARSSLDEPGIEIIKKLMPHREKIQAVVIDDFRTFGVQENVPAKSILLKAAEEFASDQYLLDVVWDMVVLRKKAN